jgi:predicted RNA-binding Zn-ribbon protein involved in translation (DUF1610 family)
MAASYCPGQDRRYWKPEDIRTVDCPSCGYKIELFKDEGKRNCPSCGTTVHNPQVLQSCAAWCAYSDACLGISTEAEKGKNSASTARGAGLAALLISFLSRFGSLSREETDLLQKGENDAAREGINTLYSAAAVKVAFIMDVFVRLDKNTGQDQLIEELRGRVPKDIAEEASRVVSGFPGQWPESGNTADSRTGPSAELPSLFNRLLK